MRIYLFSVGLQARLLSVVMDAGFSKRLTTKPNVVNDHEHLGSGGDHSMTCENRNTDEKRVRSKANWQRAQPTRTNTRGVDFHTSSTLSYMQSPHGRPGLPQIISRTTISTPTAQGPKAPNNNNYLYLISLPFNTPGKEVPVRLVRSEEVKVVRGSP